MADITPSTTATQLAGAYTAAAQSLLAAQTKNVQASSTALTKLQTALGAFTGALNSLSGAKGVARHGATFSDTALGTASASTGAQPGSYSVFVEQVATVHQVAYEDLPAVPVALGGPLVVKLDDGTDFTVNLAVADQNGDGTISHAEIARAINQAPDNQGKATAMTVTSGSQTQLVLSAGQSGAANRIALDTSGLPAGALKDALDVPKELSAARDAIVWLGEQNTGIRLQQASNTFTAIDGVSFTVARAMQAGTPPAQLTVAADDAGTSANVRSFVDAYNALEKALDELTANGSENTQRAALASDAGVLALRNRLASTLRQSYDGLRLADFGISASRDGSLTLDDAKLRKGLAAHPDGLDQVFGKTGLANASGALGAFQTAARLWTDVSSGQIKQRRDSLQAQQKALAVRQDRLDLQYTQAYNRYLAQFTQLQALQTRMNDTAGLFGNLATSSS